MVRSHLVDLNILRSRARYNPRVLSHLLRLAGNETPSTGVFKPIIDTSGLSQPPQLPTIPIIEDNQVVSPDLDLGL